MPQVRYDLIRPTSPVEGRSGCPGAAGGKSHAMSATLWLPLIIKALTTALLVVSASVAAERLGSVWGAVIASLPVSAGPAYVFIAMQHGPEFVAASALNSSVANAATGVFLITYSTLIRRFPPWCCLATAVVIWLVASIVLQQVSWPAPAAAVLNLLVYGLGLFFVNGSKTAEPGPLQPSVRRWFELPLRAALVAAFVSLVVAGSATLGPAVTGFAAVFPVSLISLVVILQGQLGSQASARVATKALAPMLGFGAMLLVLHLTIQLVGVVAAMSLALVICVLWSLILLLVQGARPLGGTACYPRRS